jgi:UDP-2,3-diacylglucosamine pyrophosphatase LpxH
MTSPQQLTILLVSDIHLSQENCKKTAQWCEENKIKPDFILNSGDMANIKVYDDDKINKEAEDVVLALHTHLEKINKTIYYIPGNVLPFDLII